MSKKRRRFRRESVAAQQRDTGAATQVPEDEQAPTAKEAAAADTGQAGMAEPGGETAARPESGVSEATEPDAPEVAEPTAAAERANVEPVGATPAEPDAPEVAEPTAAAEPAIVESVAVTRAEPEAEAESEAEAEPAIVEPVGATSAESEAQAEPATAQRVAPQAAEPAVAPTVEPVRSGADATQAIRPDAPAESDDSGLVTGPRASGPAEPETTVRPHQPATLEGDRAEVPVGERTFEPARAGTTPDDIAGSEAPSSTERDPAAIGDASSRADESPEFAREPGEPVPPAPLGDRSVPASPDILEAPSAALPGEHEAVGAEPAEGAAAWRRLFRMARPRATKANVLGGLLAILLGLAIATQVQLTQERGLSELSQSELIRVLDDVSVRSSRLDAQIRELEATRDRLRSGAGTSAEALEQAQKRADTLGILAGTVGATGPGVTVTLRDPERALTGPIILDLIQELRDAGAEAIDVGGVRVVASSFIGELDGDIAVDGVRVRRPIVIKAIGESKTLSSAMTIPGGIVETVRQKGATATVAEAEKVEITSLHTATEPKHAKPVE